MGVAVAVHPGKARLARLLHTPRPAQWTAVTQNRNYVGCLCGWLCGEGLTRAPDTRAQKKKKNNKRKRKVTFYFVWLC